MYSAVADRDDGHVAEHPLDWPPAVQFADRHEVVPAGLDEVRHRFGLVGACGLAVGEVAAQEPAGPRRRQPRQPQHPRAAGDHHGRRLQAGRSHVRGRVHGADAHLLLMLLGPVSGAGERGGHRGGQAGEDQPPGGGLIAWPGAATRNQAGKPARSRRGVEVREVVAEAVRGAGLAPG
jgi:hypothetical protein